MSAIKILAVLLILGGALGLAYGRFTFTKETHDAKIGPFDFSIQEKETVHIPDWVGAVAISGGVLLLLFDRRT